MSGSLAFLVMTVVLEEALSSFRLAVEMFEWCAETVTSRGSV